MTNLDNIRNIVFDLGGVVIDLQRERAVAALSALGLKDADSMLGLYRQEEPFLGLETGRLSAGEFFDLLRPLCGGASDMQITNAFNEFLVDLPVERLSRLLELRRAGYRVYALSNTNPVMFGSWIASKFRAQGLSVGDYFDGIVVSFQELTCKPDPVIFQRVLSRFNLIPEQTLMLDDSAANCDSARSVGMQALQVGTDPQSDMLALTLPLLNRSPKS